MKRQKEGVKVMKLFFSLILLLTISINAYGRDIILISFDKHEEKALVVQKILLNKFSIPKKLIQLKRSKRPCDKKIMAVMHICISDKNEMLIPVIDKDSISSFKVFFEEKTARL
jgi:hypothetical protein